MQHVGWQCGYQFDAQIDFGNHPVVAVNLRSVQFDLCEHGADFIEAEVLEHANDF